MPVGYYMISSRKSLFNVQCLRSITYFVLINIKNREENKLNWTNFHLKFENLSERRFMYFEHCLLSFLFSFKIFVHPLHFLTMPYNVLSRQSMSKLSAKLLGTKRKTTKENVYPLFRAYYLSTTFISD